MLNNGLKEALVVFSGGMDSTVLFAHALQLYGVDAVTTLTFHYGSKHNEQEIRAAKKITDYYRVKFELIEMPFIGELFRSDLLKSGGDIPKGHYADPTMKKTVVPFRNGIFLSIAAGYAESLGIRRILIGNHKGDHSIYPDCRSEFIQSMGRAIHVGTYLEVELLSPFCELTKTDICKTGAALKAPFNLTYSCYKGNEVHCGVCGTCYERREAFRRALVIDPTLYGS